MKQLQGKLATYGDSFYLKCLERELSVCDSLLDLGCGEESPISQIKSPKYSVGVDAYKESVEKSKKKKIHTKYKVADIRKVTKQFKRNEFDAVIAIDVVEHLKKNESKKLLKEMDRIAKKRIILLTPNGYLDQEALDGNPYQVHHSGWEPKDFSELGFEVYGLRGWKRLRGDNATITRKPWLFWAGLSFASERILHTFPEQSFDIFAVKRK